MAVLPVACGGDTDGGGADSAPGAQTDGKAAATIGATGGKVTTTAGVGVEVPEGALPNNVQISVSSAPAAAPPAGSTALGTPHVFGPSGLQFAKAVTVVLEFDAAKIPPGKTSANIVVFTAPEGTTNFLPLPTKVRDATHVEATTTHFSVMVPIIAEATAPIDAGTGTPRDGGCGTRLCGFTGPGTCGAVPDGCGGTLDCGACPPTGGISDAGPTGPNDGGGETMPDAGVCMNPLTCANYELAEGPLCGSFPDGCGRSLSCSSGCDASAPIDAGPGPVSDASSPPRDGGPMGPICGDALLGEGEGCDDGNTASGDGCTDTCEIEPGFFCPIAGMACFPYCGSASLEPGEECDDGNKASGDGCSSTCSVEPGWACHQPNRPCVRVSACGDGQRSAEEACDDGNTTSGDGCSATCEVEPNYVCPTPGQPCVAPVACGDGRVTGSETCDDGNKAPHDGCSATCQIEAGWACPTPNAPCVLQ